MYLIKGPVIFFDGYCNLCNGFVHWIVKRDRKGIFQFAPLQSDAAYDLLPEELTSVQEPDTVILLHNHEISVRSEAVIRILRMLRLPWSAFSYARFIPLKIRERMYIYIASNRYRWFGKREECIIPDQNMEERFLR
jgi:predicted DCC family thiol-disulfide oxidoreductase YuxK